ncbi:energy transducer TonB [Sphingomonas sp. Leaf17]|uniref:energy transducer TonB n=1 Tax=Sphingomonas sp. Leaf17 TaxID=1735683 RepID=UPI0006F88CA2|nr:energy transducer TonB [Sphingomonas sp. Leaf17]KQM63392.1 energy transducer TonB [Sphingomonas sp. Leaf17]
MAYVDQKMSSGKVVAIVIVALIHIALGYAFVTGLAYQYVKKASEKLNTFDVEPPPPPPPPDEPPPPPPDTPMQPPPVVSPPPIVQNPNPPPVVVATVPTPPQVYVPTPIAAPPAPPAPVSPPAPPAPVVSKAAGAKGSPASWVSNDDYPPSAIRAGEEGSVGMRWEISTSGRVENCVVTQSSGSSTLDRAACTAMTRRGRYSPALDQAGNPIRSASGARIRWTLPKD